jgi:diguanylate cyclase (GGDEF)-like protein/PAS domain S-box-containing protein
LYRWGYKCWPAIYAAAFLVNFSINASWIMAAGIAAGNTAGPLMAVWLLRRLPFRPNLERAYDVVLLTLIGAIGMTLSATVGVGNLLLHGVISAAAFSQAWSDWWLGDAIGVLLVSPLLVSVTKAEVRWLWQQRAGFALWLLLAAASVGLMFFLFRDNLADATAILFLLPLVIWAAMRYNIAGASFAVLCLSFLVAGALALDSGSLQQSAQQGMFSLWVLMSLMMMVTLMIAGLQVEYHSAEKALQESEIRVRAIVDASLDAIVTMDRHGRITEFNPAAERIFGHDKADVMGRELAEIIIPPAYRQRHRQGLQRFFATGEQRIFGRRLELEGLRADGSIFPIELTITSIKLQGQLLVTGFVRDISRRKLAEQELKIAANAFEVDQGIMVMDADRTILRVNQAYTRLTGYGAEEVIGKKPAEFLYGQQNEAFHEAMWEELQRDHRWQGQRWDRRKNGDTYMQSLMVSAVTNDRDEVINYVASFADITLHMQAEQQIRELAYYDPLTHLPNRLLLIDRLSHAIISAHRNGCRGALLFIDLDNFKTLNDTRGHDIGDLLLIEVGQRLLNCVRSEDTVARLGGDEFVVVLEKLNNSESIASSIAEQIGEKILVALGKPYDLQEQAYHTTPSIGVSLFGARLEKVEELLKRADTAMYQAKNAGRNTLCFYDPLIQAALEARSAMEAELRVALEHHDFQLDYQMQVDYRRRIIGAEVLLRWHHSQRGIIHPAQFIAMAEDTGLIVPVGLWVLESACAQLKKWESQASMRELQLAVNVSARQFRQADFAEQVQAIVARTGIVPGRLKLELTESLVLDNVSDAIAKMAALKPLGIGFSIDDFGTGHSSLAYLKKLPLSQLKIDQSFVRDIATDPSDAVIVQTIIGMSKNLGLEVIAEGVETEQQLAFLHANGCLAYQGYLFGKPMAIEEFEKHLQ